MTRATQAQIETARRLLALEGVTDGADAGTPSGRVYDKLHGHLVPLLGRSGIEMLFVRSAKLTGGDLAPLAAASLLDGAAKLRQALWARDPEVSPESAAAFFGTFVALLATFIGERLTHRTLRRVWPALDETPPRETRK